MSEFVALRRVYDGSMRRWAYEQATFHNAHFVTDGAPWQPDDFLGTGNRAARLAQAKRDKAETDMLNAKLAQIERTKGKGVQGIPFWAQPDWDGKAPEGYKGYRNAG